MTPASIQALQHLRDFSTLKWYIIPLFAIVLYIYAVEMRKARESGNWDPVFAGLTLFGMDFFNESWNGWALAISGRSAFWTAPGDTALRTMVGWNIEIMLMFAIAGIVFYYMCPRDKAERILGIPARWFWAVAMSAFCVLVECVLNIGGLLVWEYPFWKRSFGGIWLIFVFGYFEFFVAINLVLALKTNRRKLATIGIIYAVPVLMNVFGYAIMGWKY
ncbi:MAG TPA: hypothetical protein VHE79_08790 [Spirochaetia bacterium]